MKPHAHRHWSQTPCLCQCHYIKAPCNDKVCERVIKSETLAAQPKGGGEHVALATA